VSHFQRRGGTPRIPGRRFVDALIIFTLPHQAAPLALQNPTVVYGILFRAVSEAQCQMAADPKRLGVRIGFLASGTRRWRSPADHALADIRQPDRLRHPRDP
jgi:hypothetical protein